MSFLRIQLRHLWQFYLAPAVPSVLPWPLAYACYRLLARSRSLYADTVAGTAAVAPDYVGIADRAAFARDVRTIWLLDAADLYRSRRHAPAWMPGDIDVRGSWPERGAFVALSFHYSTGIWVFRDLHRHDRRVALVAARWDKAELKGLPLYYRYGVMRKNEVERIAREPAVFRPGARAKLLDVLRRGHAVIGVMDMPPRLAPNGQRPVELLGRPASLPDGMLQLAAEAGVPVVPYWIEIDLATGRRTLVIGAARDPLPADAVLAGLAADLDGLIRKTPAAWLFWNEWPQWLADAAALREPAVAAVRPDADDAVG